MTCVNLTRLFVLTTLFLANWALAVTPDELEQKIEQHLLAHYRSLYPQAQTEIVVNPVSPRLQLGDCHQPIELFPPQGSGARITLKVQCNQPRWRLFASATRKHLQPVVVTSRPLIRGRRLEPGDLKLEAQDLALLQGPFYTSLQPVIGWQLKRNLGRGQLLQPSQLVEPLAVQQGDAVIIEARRGALSIRTAGTALESGKQQQQIRVRNDKTGREIKAVVIAPGHVLTP